MSVKQGDLSSAASRSARTVAVKNSGALVVRVDGCHAASGPHLASLERKRAGDGNASEAPKLKALAKNPKVSLTIGDNAFLHKVLLIRGTAQLKTVEGVVPEYAAAAERYFGREPGRAWVAQMGKMVSSMVRVAVKPEWVGVLDFQTRFPSALPI